MREREVEISRDEDRVVEEERKKMRTEERAETGKDEKTPGRKQATKSNPSKKQSKDQDRVVKAVSLRCGGRKRS